MKRYQDLTQEEKEELTEEDLEKYIKYELMELGTTPEPPGAKPTLPGGLEFKNFYQIGGFVFRTMKDAEKMISLHPLQETYDYNIGYNVKFAKERKPDDLRITLVEFATAETVLDHAEELARYNEEYDTWSSKNERNNRYNNNRLNVIKKITSDFENVQKLKQDRILIANTLEEYKTLAINNDAALKFLIKTFGKERIKAVGIEIQDEEE